MKSRVINYSTQSIWPTHLTSKNKETDFCKILDLFPKMHHMNFYNMSTKKV